MRRPLLFAVLLLSIVGTSPSRAAATDQAGPDCDPLGSLMFQDAVPSLRQVAAGAGRLHFVKGGAEQAGCPSAAPACLARAFVVPGNAVIVVASRADYACAAFAGPAPRAAATSGWLPQASLVVPPAPSPDTPPDWRGDWRAGPERRIRITPAPHATEKGSLALSGEATFGATDPERVKRGAVNMGNFDTVATPTGDHLAFLDGEHGPLPYDAARAKADFLCGLRLWRLGPYLVVADNLQCGGMNVTFTGVYRRIGDHS